ncbi:hypothetical protein G6F31_018287 [Rhizopus arrhizus]|nr:hypothetical protein G6F31_018287 [Rhizopus arrhizus]
MDQHAPAPEEIESIDVEIFTHALKIAGVEWPAKPAETCFSLRYVVARLLLAGKLGIEDMESPDLHAPGLLALARRITVRTSEVFQQEFPRLRPCRVTLTLKDGRQWSALRKLRKGDPEDPYTWAALQARMRAFAPAMDDAAARAIVLGASVLRMPARTRTSACQRLGCLGQRRIPRGVGPAGAGVFRRRLWASRPQGAWCEILAGRAHGARFPLP